MGETKGTSSKERHQKKSVMFKTPWCRLLSQNGTIPTVAICTSCFVVGSTYGDLILHLQSSAGTICEIKLIMCGSTVFAKLEYKNNRVALLINGMQMQGNATCILSSGDELVLGYPNSSAFVFQQLVYNMSIISGTNLNHERQVGYPSRQDASHRTEKRDWTRDLKSLQSFGLSVREAIFKECIHEEILHGRDIKVSFNEFPYYLSERTTNQLLAASYIHLKHSEQPKYISADPRMYPRILLSGPAGSEIYQEMLAKSLAKYYGAKLLIFDRHSIMAGLSAKEVELQKEGNCAENSNNTIKQNSGTHFVTWGPRDSILELATPNTSNVPSLHGTLKNPLFKLGDRVRFSGPVSSSSLYVKHFPSRGPTSGNRGIVVLPFEANSLSKVGVKFDNPVPVGVDFAGLCDKGHGWFCNAKELCLEGTSEEDLYRLLIPTLFEVVCSESRSSPFILFIKDAMKSVVENAELHAIFKSTFEKFPENFILIGSQTHTDDPKEKESFGQMHYRGKEVAKETKIPPELFSNEVTVHAPQDKSLLVKWKQQLVRDSETIKMKGNHNCLHAALFRRGLECDALETLCIKEQSLTNESVEEVVTYALIHQAIQNSEANLNAISTLSGDSIQHGLGMLQPNQNESNILNSLKDVVITENKFEDNFLDEVIPPHDIEVRFEDIGGLENVKNILKELVIVPLQIPEHFCKSQLTKDVLLFGPPGTGKSMLAKAVATEAGANFINISMSSIISKCFGEGEGEKIVKNCVKAIFTLASKIAPTVVFLDEVDSMFGRKENPLEPVLMHKIKYEFMLNWDDIRTKDREQVFVLAATNKPFNLDEAVIKRLARRLMFNLPDATNRAKVLNLVLASEGLTADVDLNLVANMTNWYSGSDLKELCVTAADHRVQELLAKERKEHSAVQADGKPTPALSSSADIRSLNMDDFRKALEQVRGKVASESRYMKELQRWNELYVEEDSGRKNVPIYFL